MSYHELPDIRTDKAPRHQLASKKKVQRGPLFTFETVEKAKDQLRNNLNFPYVHIHSSTLGGKENVSVLVTISKDPKETWYNGILENSRCAKIHISNNGTTEQFSGWRLKMRKFKGKNIPHIAEKINNIKDSGR